jgi:hypothetical protein
MPQTLKPTPIGICTMLSVIDHRDIYQTALVLSCR